MNAQALEALGFGNEVRMAIVAAKRQIRAPKHLPSCRRAAADLVEHPPPLVERARVSVLLNACYGQYVQRTRLDLNAIGASEFLRVGALTDRQRTVLCGRLRGETE